MKFGLRTPSLNRRIAARTSFKRFARHSLGLKAPRGMGIITNPKRAMYNRVYNRTTFGIRDLVKVKANLPSAASQHTFVSTPQTIAPADYNQPFSLQPLSFLQLLNTKDASGNDTVAGFAILFGLILLFLNPLLGILLLGGGIFWVVRIAKQPKYKEKQAIVKAKKEIKANNLEKALIYLKEAYTLNENNPETNYLLGTTLNMSGNYEESISYLIKYITSNPSDLDAELVLAYSYYQIKNYKEATALLQKFPPEHLNYLLVILLLGDCFLNMKEYEMAIEVFNRGPVRKTNFDSYLIQLHYMLGLAYKEKGDKTRAIQQMQKVYSADINYREVASELEKLRNN